MCWALVCGRWPSYYDGGQSNIPEFGTIIIQGSDLRASKSLADSCDFKLYLCQSASNLSTSPPTAFIHTTATGRHHPEMKKARELKIPMWSRGQLLAVLSRYFNKTVVCSGTCGKTTTSSLLYHLFNQENASLVLGGQLRGTDGEGFESSTDSRILVVEADESDSTHTLFQPDLGVLLSCTPDHLEQHGSFESLEKSMWIFAQNTGECLLLNHDDPHLRKLKHRLKSEHYHPSLISVGWHPQSEIHLKLRHVSTHTHVFTLQHKPENSNNLDLTGSPPSSSPLQKVFFFLKKPFPVKISTIGKHNIHNAAMACVTYLYHCASSQKLAGLSSEAGYSWFEGYKGVMRRLEILYQTTKFVVINDYAHNPEKIVAAIEASRGAYPQSYLEVIFEPHKKQRLFEHSSRYYEAFRGVHHLMIAPLYEPLSGPTHTKSQGPCYNPQAYGSLIAKHSQVKVSHLDSYLNTGHLITPQHSQKFLKTCYPDRGCWKIGTSH